MTPLVSILIPAFNAAPWLGATLDSALAQTHPRCEIIVVDDGSTDATAALAHAVADRHPDRVQVVTQPNAGAAAARNHALRLARGDFIQYLDADDLLAPSKIALQIAALADAPERALASGSWGRFRHDPAATDWREEPVARARTGAEFLQIHYETGSMMQPGAWLAPRNLLDRAGPWNESLSLNDDGEYFARVLLQASCLVAVPEAGCHYRSNISSSLSRKRNQAALMSLQRSVDLTIRHLLAADNSPRSRAAAALGWRALAFELYPDASGLARTARRTARDLGTPGPPRGGPPWVGNIARLVGWTVARKLHLLRNQM